jgi:hypothetical protein
MIESEGAAMAASTALESVADIESFVLEYYAAWGGMDEDRIMSYYADNVTFQTPGSLMQRKLALREQFVRPFITGFPGNRHVVKNMILGRDVVLVEFTFEAVHKGPFAGRAATDAGRHHLCAWLRAHSRADRPTADRGCSRWPKK